jgi:hypothetical protein
MEERRVTALKENCCCVGCNELNNPEPQCACENPGPIYNAEVCEKCQDKKNCWFFQEEISPTVKTAGQ